MLKMGVNFICKKKGSILLTINNLIGGRVRSKPRRGAVCSNRIDRPRLAAYESVEKALFWLFSNSQAFDFIDSEFTKNGFSYRLYAQDQRQRRAEQSLAACLGYPAQNHSN